MSGPKVVRVVTREELIAHCQGLLARLDAALAAWIRDGRSNDVVSEDEIAAAERRRDQIRSLLNRDRFMDLQKGAAEEIHFLKSDQQARLTKAALAAARARTAERREADAAAALLASLMRSGRAITAELQRDLEAAAAGKAPAAKALTAGFALLSAPAEADREKLEVLARSLKDQEGDRSFESWLGRQPAGKDDVPLARVESRLAELATMAGGDAAATFETRLTALRGGEGGDRRSLLLDSLSLDAGKALAEARARAELAASLDLALAELATLDSDRAKALSAAAVDQGANGLEGRLQEVDGAIKAARDGLAAAARRQAVLQGLAALGYEVGAELSTAWVQDGRVVLRKPDQPGYGVELAGGAAADRVQMRVVAFEEAGADAGRDRNAETLWCHDVEALQAKLAAAGGSLVIDRALAVGATPVKRVAAASGESRWAAREGPAGQTRTLI